MAIGTAAADRDLLFGFTAVTNLSATTVMSSLTVDGSATGVAHIVTELDGIEVNNAWVSFWWKRAHTTGTTADLVATLSSNTFDLNLFMWELNGVDDVDDTATSEQADPADLSLDVHADGVAAAISYSHTSGSGISWTGMTQRADELSYGVNALQAADYAAGSTETPRTVTANYTGSPTRMASASVSFTALAGGGALSVNLAGRGGLAGAGGLAGVGGGLVSAPRWLILPHPSQIKIPERRIYAPW